MDRKAYNPKTGKWFCKDKCWLNNSPSQTSSQGISTNGNSNAVNGDNKKNGNAVDGDNKKFDGSGLLTAKRIAGEYANLMLNYKFITPDQWDKTFQDKAREISNYEIRSN
ncbi:MAG: hypothetical protein MUE70_09530 [Desulfobacterales bacterium]|jgi:hypothetical protein|nr:hypothetical protein [Desulfobacterales bacterium]